MYKVLIVDDEYFPREALKTTIPWEKYGCTVCGEANNGFDGIDKALELKPDIILTDINMPFMDGLDMIMHLQKNIQGILYSIITGYSEFEYAKRGIELGVEHYILKPIDDIEVVEILEKMVESLDKKHQKEQEYDSLRYWAEKNSEENQKNFLSMLLMGEWEISEDQFAYECEQLDIPLQKTGYGVCCLNIDSRSYVHISQKEWQRRITDMMGKAGEEYRYIVCYKGEGNLYIIFYDITEQEWDFAAISALMQNIQIALMKEWVCTVKAGVGKYCPSYAEISQSRTEAEKTVQEIAVSKLIMDMLQYIHSNYADSDLSLREIAEKLFVNYSYLSAQFAKEMGMSASQYIVRFRMTKAADMLRSGMENMVEIACSVGYTDVKYFYRCFKKEFGITPYQYIDILRETRERKRKGEEY